ncbi:MAG: hypothetical protein IKA71_04840 [Lentisphaeria bacterium]|nr:hypothetical protein [Lentisphaeria bacterium]
MKIQKIGIIAILFIGTFLFCGCEIFEEALQESYASDDPTSEEYEPRFVLGVFEIVNYPRATSLEKQINTRDGRQICINVNPIFSSRRIRAVKAVPRPGNPDVCDLELRIDRMGKTQWQMLSDGHRGEMLTLMIDSRHVGDFIPEHTRGYGNDEWVKIRVGMDSYTARGVAKFAKKNYSFYNPEASDWFNQLF